MSQPNVSSIYILQNPRSPVQNVRNIAVFPVGNLLNVKITSVNSRFDVEVSVLH